MGPKDVLPIMALHIVQNRLNSRYGVLHHKFDNQPSEAQPHAPTITTLIPVPARGISLLVHKVALRSCKLGGNQTGVACRCMTTSKCAASIAEINMWLSGVTILFLWIHSR